MDGGTSAPSGAGQSPESTRPPYEAPGSTTMICLLRRTLSSAIRNPALGIQNRLFWSAPMECTTPVARYEVVQSRLRWPDGGPNLYGSVATRVVIDLPQMCSCCRTVSITAIWTPSLQSALLSDTSPETSRPSTCAG